MASRTKAAKKLIWGFIFGTALAAIYITWERPDWLAVPPTEHAFKVTQ